MVLVVVGIVVAEVDTCEIRCVVSESDEVENGKVDLDRSSTRCPLWNPASESENDEIALWYEDLKGSGHGVPRDRSLAFE